MSVITNYVNAETMRLGLIGFAAASLAGIVWRVAGRFVWGATPFVLTAMVAARWADRSDMPRWSGTVAFGGYC